MNEILIIILSMLASFIVGVVGVFMLGNSTTWNYFKVKISKGKKVLVFLKTKFGWKTHTATKVENYLVWKYDKIHRLTTIMNDDEIHKYGVVDFVFIDLENDKICLKSNTETIYPPDFDSKVYGNLLERAITSPHLDDNTLNKFLIVVIVLVVIAILFGVLNYAKMGEIMKLLGTMELAKVI